MGSRMQTEKLQILSSFQMILKYFEHFNAQAQPDIRSWIFSISYHSWGVTDMNLLHQSDPISTSDLWMILLHARTACLRYVDWDVWYRKEEEWTTPHKNSQNNHGICYSYTKSNSKTSGWIKWLYSYQKSKYSLKDPGWLSLRNASRLHLQPFHIQAHSNTCALHGFLTKSKK